MLERQVAREVPWNRSDQPGVLGIDEIALRKGHRDFVTIITRRSSKRELARLVVLPGRHKKGVAAFLISIRGPLDATVEQVWIQMWRERMVTYGIVDFKNAINNYSLDRNDTGLFELIFLRCVVK